MNIDDRLLMNWQMLIIMKSHQYQKQWLDKHCWSFRVRLQECIAHERKHSDDIIFKYRRQIANELTDFIHHENHTNTSKQWLDKHCWSFRVRLQECIAHERKHLDDIIFKYRRQIANELTDFIHHEITPITSSND